MESIQYYAQEDGLKFIISCLEYKKLKTLDVDHIHSNKNNVIEKFVAIFEKVLKDLEDETSENYGLANDVANLSEIIDALKKREKAIQDITLDVLKRREECCCY